MSTQPRIEQLWELFLQAERGSYERSALLDVFLCDFFLQVKTGKPQEEILSFCIGRGITTLIACELLSKIHQICSQGEDDEDLKPLRKFLLEGPGWRSLTALHCLGVQNLSCAQDIASLLITIYPLCMKNHKPLHCLNNNPFIQKKEKSDIEEVLKLKTPPRKFSHGFVLSPTRVEFLRSHSNTSTTRLRRQKSTQSCASQEEVVTSESERADDENRAKPSTLKIRLNPMDFDYFTSVIRSTDEERLASHNYTPSKRKVKEERKTAEDFKDEKIREVMKRSISDFEFALIVLDLLESLCSMEQVAAFSDKQPMCIQVLNFILENLCTLQFDFSPSKDMGIAEVTELKSSLTRLMLVSLEKVRLNEQATTTFIQRGMLPVVIKILEDAIRKMAKPTDDINEISETSDTAVADKSTDEANKMHEFLFGLTFGILTFIYHLLLQRSCIDRIGDFLELYHLFTESQGGRLIDKIIATLIAYPNVSPSLKLARAKRIIDYLGHMIVTLKKSRTEIMHASICRNKRHRQCGALDNGTHHHRDLFGSIYVASLVGASSTPSCCIASLFMVLVRLLHSGHSEIVSRTLKVMTSSGTCCCFPVRSLIQTLVDVFKTSSPKIRAIGLSMLERTIYWELGALEKPGKLMKFCTICDDETVPTYTASLGYGKEDSASDIHVVDPSNESPKCKPVVPQINFVGLELMKPRNCWTCLNLFIVLLESPDAKLRHTLTSHILKVAPRCTLSVKKHLLFQVIYPVFLKAKSQIQMSDKLSMFTVLSCLSIFSSLLPVSSFARKFIDLQGLDHIRDLIGNPALSKLCCSILEITAVVEIWQLECEIGSISIPQEEFAASMRTLPSLLMLQGALLTSSRKLLNRIEHNLTRTESPGGHCSHLNTIPAALENTISQTDFDNVSVDLKTLSISDIVTIENSDLEESYLMLLLDACIFWRSCANLALTSPQYRICLANDTVISDGYTLLKTVTSFVAAGITFAGSQCQALEVHLYMKLLEATLIVNLAAPPMMDCDGQRLKKTRENILEVVRQLLLAVSLSADLRQLCDVLLRCARIQTSQTQVLPPSRSPKLPPLALGGWTQPASGTSDDEGDALPEEVSEDMYITADEGYEADVEVLPLTPGNDPNLSASLDTKPSRTERGSSIVHTQLCSLSVELLVKIHSRYLDESKSKNHNPYISVPDEISHLTTLVHCLQRVAALCRESTLNCCMLATIGLIKPLLEGFHDILTSRDAKYAEVQRVILELVTLLANHRITPQDLSLYIRLFKAANPPLDTLLSPLSHLTASSQCQPHHILCFPAKQSCEKEFHFFNTDEASSLACSTHQEHSSKGLETAWSSYGLALPINSELGWSLWNGYSLALWLRVETVNNLADATADSMQATDTGSSPQSDASSDWRLMSESWKKLSGQNMTETKETVNELHLFTVAISVLSLEAWYDFSAASLVLRLVRVVSNKVDIVSEAQVANFLQLGQWHYLAMNVGNYIRNGEFVIEMSLLLDGNVQKTVTLAYDACPLRKLVPTCLLLGHVMGERKSSAGSFYLGSVMMFRTPVFNIENALYMLGLGPNCVCLADCTADIQLPNYANVVSAKALLNNVSWDLVLAKDRAVILALETQLMMTYSAHNASIVNFYPQVIMSTGHGLFPTLPGGYRIQSLEQRASHQIPLTLTPVAIAPPNSQQYQGLVSAATLLGGAPVFLFLFARVVELEAVEEVQAKALSFLLRLVQSDSEFYSQFVRQDGYKLVMQVLATKQCIAGHHVLKAILDTCCDKPVLQYHAGLRQFQVVHQSEAIITDSHLLTTVVSTWASWAAHDDDGTLATFCSALHILLRDEHPHRGFNATQLNRAHLIDTVLHFCKALLVNPQERFLFEEWSRVTPPVARSLVEIVRALLGAPPEVEHLCAVVDCLILLHRATDTYVTQSRATSYFLTNNRNSGPPFARKEALHTISVANERNNLLSVPTGSTAIPGLIIDNVTDDPDLPSPEECEKEDNDVESSHSHSLSSQPPRADPTPPVENDDAAPHALAMEALLELVRDTLRMLPDSVIEQVLNSIVTMDILLVLANTASCHVRKAVIEVMSAHIQRSSSESVASFASQHGFHLLAEQLALHPASVKLVDACCSMFMHCNLELACETGLMWDEMLPNCYGVRPVLALLPASVHDGILAKRLVGFLKDVFTKYQQTPRMLLDGGLLESLIKTLNAASHLHPDAGEDEATWAYEALIEDIRAFLVTITCHALYTTSGHHMQVLSNLQLQLGHLEKQERMNCGETSRCVSAVRDTQSIVLEAALDTIQKKIFAQQPEAASPPRGHNPLLLAMSYTYEERIFGNDVPLLKELSKTDLSERFNAILVKAVDFLVNSECATLSSPLEQSFARRLFSTMVGAVSTIVERRSHRTPWTMVVWAAKNTLRLQTAALLVWMLAPGNLTKLRVFAVVTLRGEPLLKQLAQELLRHSASIEQQFTVFLWDLVYNPAIVMQDPDKRSCQELMLQLEAMGLLTPTLANPQMWLEEVQVLCNDMEKQRRLWHQRQSTAALRHLRRNDVTSAAALVQAAMITRSVVGTQNAARKELMARVKAAHGDGVQARRRWRQTAARATHERAVWHSETHMESSWQLDSTEGPGRVRTRLQRCQLAIPNRYLMPNHHHEADGTTESEPLSFLFEGDERSSTSSVLIERLHTNEKIRHMSTAHIITPACEVSGELLVGESCVYFVADDSELVSTSRRWLDVSSTAWQFDAIKDIQKRRFQLKERAVEIFLVNGTTYLVAFQSVMDRDGLLNVLKDCSLPNRVLTDHLDDAKQMWREGLLTNWEYITQLNKMAGRSYNDLMQYPVFPFVLANYTSATLDLNDPLIFRNFKKPMAVQDKKNEQHYINTYNYLKQELMEGHTLISLNQEPYHYGSHYSNSGTVLHFLVRLPPFTGMFLTYQDNNFDLPDRTFHSLHTTWRLASSDSTTDVKEMIPEFFCLPEFLKNSEGFNFGVRQNGERVDDVHLPPWCNNNARLFVFVHRQALEALHVREHLPHWLDLVFGFKQTGKAAVDAINVFHPATYSGFDVEAIVDPLERLAWETMVKTYGQTPRQLLRVPHPMVVQALASHTVKSSVKEVMPGVKGLMWGCYLGSPAENEPVVAWKHNHRTPIASFTPLATGEVFGLPTCSSLLVAYNKSMIYSNVVSVASAAQVSWAHADSAIRIKMKKDQIPWPIIKVSALDPVCVCSTTPECNQLWLGHLSGKIAVYQYRLEPTRTWIDLESESVTLHGHTDSVVSLSLCREFSIAVSGSLDNTAIIWDLNKLCYVRSIQVGSPVTRVAISPTLGDIATVSNMSLHYHTINAAPIGVITTVGTITSVCFSTAPEGTSVNVIAAGLSNGKIRLWSTWDLNLVRELSTPFLTKAIISLSYSCDSQHLYAASMDGAMVIWERAGYKGSSKPAKFMNLASL